MPKLTREYKSELVNLVNVAFAKPNQTVTLQGTSINKTDLLHHVKTEFVTGCEIYYSSYDFTTRKASIWDSSEYKAFANMMESIAHD
jgi:hypothetical protein